MWKLMHIWLVGGIIGQKEWCTSKKSYVHIKYGNWTYLIKFDLGVWRMTPVVSDGWCTGGKCCVHIDCEKLTYLIEKLYSSAEIGTGMFRGWHHW